MSDKSQHDAPHGPPGLAIRRHTDRCFHEVEEVVRAPKARGEGAILGYILDGVMVDPEDIAEVRPISQVKGT